MNSACVDRYEVNVSIGSEIEISGMWNRSYGCADEPITIGEGILTSGGVEPHAYEWIHPTVQISNPFSQITTIVSSHTAFLDLKVTDANGCSVLGSNWNGANRYRAVFIFEQTNNALRFESLAGHHCVGDFICADPDILVGYKLNFDHDIAVSQGLYDGNFNELPQQSITGLSPTAQINATFYHYQSENISYNNLDPSINIQETGCLQFTNPGVYTIDIDYQIDVWSQLTGQSGCQITTSQQFDILIEPQITFPPQLLTEYITGPIALASPQNNKVGVVLKVAVDANQNQISTIIIPGIQADHVASERVSLRAGFRAMCGSDYTAKLNPCMEFASGKFADEEEEEDTTGIETQTLENIDLMAADIPTDAEFFNVYPNPNTGDFTVNCSNMKRLIVLDAAGRVVWDSKQSLSLESDQTEADILISGFSNGVYIVKAQRKNGAMRFRKVVVAPR